MKNPINKYIDKYVLHEILNSSIKKGFFPLEECDAYKTNLGDFSLFCQAVLSGALHTPETIEAMIWSISNYTYKELKIDPRYHIASHMRHGARGESSLHMMKEFYRDHFFHTIEVCFLGHFLLKEFSECKTGKLIEKKLLKDWYIASLLHDIGYAIDICRSLREWMGFFSSDAMNELNTDIDLSIRKINNSSDFERLYKKNGFSEDNKPWEDHGMISAIHLESLFKSIKSKYSTANIGKAINAIAKHNCQDIKFSYDKEPLSAFLVLCDTIQAWSRPQFSHFSLAPSWMMSLLYNQNNNFGNIGTIRSSLFSNLLHYNDIKLNGSKPLILRLEFTHDINHNSFVFNIWLDMLCNFQRVDFTNLPFDILVQVKTPAYYPENGESPRNQMIRLFNAKEETHMAYLDNFFKEVHKYNLRKKESIKIQDIHEGDHSCCLKSPVCYHISTNSKWNYQEERKEEIHEFELVSFNLRKMNGKKQFMTNNLSRFRHDLSRWKSYNDDRMFEGDYFPWRLKKS